MTSDPIADIIGDSRAFAAMQRGRLPCPRHRRRPYPLSHLAVRVADWDLYVHQRTLLERHARANRENVWNGRPISLIVLSEPLQVLDGTAVSNIELIPPVHQRVYRMGLEHLGVVVGEGLDEFSRVHRAALTGQQFQSSSRRPGLRAVRGLHPREVLPALLLRRRRGRGRALRGLRPRRQLGAAEAGYRHWPEPAPAVTKAAARRQHRTLRQCSGMSHEEAEPSAQLRSTAESRCVPSSPLSSTSRLSIKSIPEPESSSRTTLETSTSPPRAWLATRAA